MDTFNEECNNYILESRKHDSSSVKTPKPVPKPYSGGLNSTTTHISEEGD